MTNKRWIGLIALLVAEAMNLLDATIVQVAAPVIHGDLGGRTSDIQWFSAAYTLPFAALLITGGRLGDRYGRRRVFRIGVAAFVLTSTACALAMSPGLLIASRAIQGAAAALVIPQTIGLIKAGFTSGALAKALGTIGPVMGLAAISGPLLGGFITEVSTWRGVFLVNVPLGLAVLALSHLLPESAAPHRPKIDVLGTVLLAGGTALIVYPILQSRSWFLLIGGVVLLGLCLLRGNLIETSLFAHRGFAPALATSTLFFAVMSGLTLVVVLHEQLTLHHGVMRASLALLPWSAATGIASLVAGQWLVARFGSRLMYAGLGVLLVGLAAAPYALLPALAVVGFGVGLFTTAFFTEALHRVEPHETGSAAGLLNAVQQFGGTLGVAAFGTIFLHHPASLDRTAWVAVAVVVVTVATAHLMRSPRLLRRGRGAPAPASIGR
ncbi:EmrB/QacA subfamily drug resistance transporter [Kribbella rubisoli]|uniref:EmrB/QacA subfamily drug resistance transporter n=1 Tax=Kribbella rubisoli TaxID=3075929 RepID=A0A4Q7VYG2_9ACTN|nr:MFS transporter [Kribbella rubisoli]RZU01625.1 EmrB/QacA subfamily drug resistance transporter [Kribbella rubisoli]